MTLADLNQWWWPRPRSITGDARFEAPRALRMTGALHPLVRDDLRRLFPLDHGYTIRVSRDGALPAQGYRLAIGADGATILGGDDAGCFYGQLTLAQYLALHRDKPVWPALRIEDAPAFARRGALVDLGRTVGSLPMLKQWVRVLARLRYNELHLRLYDDELCGVRFEGLPFGGENPFALSLDELAELARHARKHHVALVPEIESWGHVGSIVYHRPNLRGGDGMYGGSSFLAGRDAARLVGELARQVLQAVPDADALHLGFDEAKWFPAPDAPADYSPCDYLLDVVRSLPAHDAELRLWADHAGRPLPDELRDRVVLQPWQYWHKNRALIDRTIAVYGHEDADFRGSWMMTLGQSQAQARGACRATRYFCRRAVNGAKNLRGVTIAQWGWNDWSGQFFTVFAGAYYAWNPLANSDFCEENDEELFDQQVMPKLIWWRSLSDDTRDLDAQRGPLVWNGRYVYGGRHGEPIAPTVERAKTFPHRAYVDAMAREEAAVPAGEVP